METDDILFALGGMGILYAVYKLASDLSPATQPMFDPSAPDSVISSITGMFGMQVSTNGQNFIKQNEGLSLSAYGDAGGYSIGYGHYLGTSGAGMTITQAQADAYFASDIANVQNVIAQYVTVPLSQNQYDALADFIYNEGAGNFSGSTLLKLLNAGDYAGAANQLNQWIYSQGAVNQTLVARREQDQTLFNA